MLSNDSICLGRYSLPQEKPLLYRTVSADVLEAVGILLERTGRYQMGSSRASLQKCLPAVAWGERGGASWGGLLKLVETQLHKQDDDYRLLRVTPTDGHQTWQLPLQITLHLITEKTICTHRGWLLARRTRSDGR